MTLTTILVKALTNTVLGMGTVFLVLIFIALLIALLPRLTAAIELIGRSKRSAASGRISPAVSDAPPEKDTVVQNLADDKEIAAVITAAICAAERIAPNEFIVRSIRKKAGNQ